MALDEPRQALLDVFCHCYGLLLEHLDFLDGAVGAHYGWSGYRLVHECVDTAANRLGSTFSKTTDRRALCEDFLRRIRGAMEHNLPADSSAFDRFSDYVAAVEAASNVPCSDLTKWQCVGEELSRACYCRCLPADTPSLSISVERVELEPSAEPKIYAVPQKEQGWGGIVCGFASKLFSFAEYVNLPFYFFHEHLSHLHSAPMFAERHVRVDHAFTEGWLLYYANSAYWRALFHEPHMAVSYSLHREHYMKRYCESVADPVKKPFIHEGYEQARRFHKLAGEARFERVTLLVASTPYNVFDLIVDLHGEFVLRVENWLRRIATMTLQEREGLLAQLDTALDGPTPVRGLMEWLIY